MDNHNLWKVVMTELENSLSRANYKMWLNDTFIAEANDETITIGVPSHFYLDWIRKNYHKSIAEILRKLRPSVREIAYKVAPKSISEPTLTETKEAPQSITIEANELNENTPNETEPKEPAKKPPVYPPSANFTSFQPVLTDLDPMATTPSGHSPLDPTRTFETFIVGNSNRLAHAVSLAASQEPGKQYNPLFLYGGVGLGKTHLAQAIGNAIRAQSPTVKITYMSCEAFTNEFIESVRKKNIDAFKRRFRQTDILLIDDVQFMSGKERTQEEFFHTFNALHQAKKQIVLTADREPHNIPAMEERLTSRFAWGMVADIQPPDFETRVAILRAKCLEHNYEIDDAALQAIAQAVQTNIRDLEGALRSIRTRAQIENRPLDVAFVNLAVNHSGLSSRGRGLNPNRIIDTVCHYFELKTEEVTGQRRFKELVYPRQLIMYLLRHELSFSYPNIGKALGGKDHTTVMHGVGKIDKEIARNTNIQYDLAKLKEQIYQDI